jgi:hypothetical protein
LYIYICQIPLEDYQIAAYYGLGEEMDYSSDGESDQVPTFRANLPSTLFLSTLLDKFSIDGEREELVENYPKKVTSIRNKFKFINK